jgi:hypothetical protein
MNNEASLEATLSSRQRNPRVASPTRRKPLKVIIDTPTTEDFGELSRAAEAAPYSSEHATIVLLKSEEVAARWRITRQKVNQMRVAGQLKAIQLPSGTFRYDLAEILRLEKPVLPSRQTEKARSAEAIKRGRGRPALALTK